MEKYKSFIEEYDNKLLGINFEKLYSYFNDCKMGSQSTCILSPLFYLFDDKFKENTKISLIPDALKTLISSLNLNELFTIERDNMTYMSLSSHATIFYKFNYNERNYIYYSNSGLGINNQLCYREMTSCKIFHIKTDLFLDLPIFINNFIQFLKSTDLNDEDYESDYYTFIRQNKYTEIFKFTKEDFKALTDFYNNFSENFHQNLVYALLHYFCYTHPNDIQQCTINHVLLNMDSTEFINIRNNLIKFTDFKNYLMNTLEENQNISRLAFIQNNILVQTNFNNVNCDVLTKFNKYIIDITSELNKYEKIYSFKYKLENSFKLEYYFNTGLFNNQQQAGSCTFYSYYNLAINMLILNKFKEANNVDCVIKSILVFHYYMMYLLCVSFDTKYFSKQIKYFNRYNFNFMKYFYDLIDDNITNELNVMYKSDTFLLTKTPQLFIDKYYSNINIEGSKLNVYTNKLKPIDNFASFFSKFYSCLNNYIYKIRNKIDVDLKSLRDTLLATINFSELHETPHYDDIKICKEPDGFSDGEDDDDGWVNDGSDDSDGGGNGTDIIKISYIAICEIWVIYINILNDIYHTNSELKKYDQKISTLLNFYIPNCNKIKDNLDTYVPIIDIKSDIISFEDLYYSGTDMDCVISLPYYYLNYNELLNISIYLNTNNLNDVIKKYDCKYGRFLTCYNIRNNKTSKCILPWAYTVYSALSIGHNSIFQNENANSGIFLKYWNDTIHLDAVNYYNYFENKHYPPDSDIIYKIQLLYIECTHRINNEHIDSQIKDYYKNYKLYLKKYIEEKNLLKPHLYLSGNYSFYFLYTLYILLDEELLLICALNKDYNSLNNSNIYIFSILNKDTKIYNINHDSLNSDDKTEIYKIIKNYNTISDRIDHILLYLGSYENKIKWFLDLKNSIKFIEKDYICIHNPSNQLDSYLNGFELIINRFGIDISDTKNYMIFIHKTIYNSYTNNITIKGESYIFIIIHNEKKILKLNFNNSILDKTNCYLINSKAEQFKLIFDLNKNEHPFINLFPENSAYLCYNDKNVYNLLYIIKHLNKITASKLEDKSQNELNIIHFKFAPSEIFPTISTYDNSIYHDLFKLYENTKIPYLSNNVDTQFNFIIEQKYNNFINDIYDKICSIIKCTLEQTNIYEFDSIINKYTENSKSKTFCDQEKSISNILTSFLSENRLIDFTIIDNDKTVIKEYINKFVECKQEIYKSMIYNDNIIQNLSKFIYIMEFNLLIKYINEIVDTININSGEIQGILNSIHSIQTFNNKKHIYYNFEILYLLQNEYFFKESQIEKYIKIRDHMNEDNKKLILHQFMMGKGKTSVITPLLSFYGSIIKNKIPTIITLAHLVKPTEKYITFIKHFTKIEQINILSDFQAKERWLNNTDNELVSQDTPININNEINIIDEIDTQHNYLNSMFNMIRSGKQPIGENYIKYIFDFVMNDATIPIESTYDSISEIFKEGILQLYRDTHLMEYNKNYGFEYMFSEDKMEYNYRICSPFIRKDTPLKKSQFSNIFLTLILTIKAYKLLTNNEFKLLDQLYDYNNILQNINILKKILDIMDKKDSQRKLMEKIVKNEDSINSVKLYFDNYYKSSTIQKNKEILKLYLFEINNDNISYSTEQYNVSFQDIIYNNYKQWQVGYTGTASLTLNKYESSEEKLFKCVDEDPDEFIEIYLSFLKFGTDQKDKTILFIATESIDLENNINTIITHLQQSNQIARGIVDLAGLFINYENKLIAWKLKQKLESTKKIVYFNSKDKGIEYGDDEKEYTESDKDNFYYYDNCHTVGSDLKQPYDGHVGIIININTRYTDFAQALFRFRKMNRGTYMSIIYIYNSSENISKINNDYIYNLLQTNENNYNKNQENGIKYQLLKTIIRKYTGIYKETNLINPLLVQTKFNKPELQDYINKNILSIDSIDRFLKNYIINKEDSYKYIKELYHSIINLDESTLYQLIFGNSNIELNSEADATAESNSEQSSQSQAEAEAEATQFSKKDLTKIQKYHMENKSIIRHLNCEKCIQFNCVKLFKDEIIQIQKKPIYISLNILNDTIKNITYLCFVEFHNMILIENEKVAIDYYINKLPVYSFNGRLLLNHMSDRKLIVIDKNFIKLFGIEYYLDPEISDDDDDLINNVDIIDKLTQESLTIIMYHIILLKVGVEQPETEEYNNIKLKYNICIELHTKIENLIADNPPILIRNIIPDQHNISQNIENVYFDIYNNILKLNENEYNLEIIPTVPFENMYIAYKYDITPIDGGCVYDSTKCFMKKSKKKVKTNVFKSKKYDKSISYTF